MLSVLKETGSSQFLNVINAYNANTVMPCMINANKSITKMKAIDLLYLRNSTSKMYYESTKWSPLSIWYTT